MGVVHGDPNGYSKLRSFFEQVRPEVISIEISNYSWRYRRRRTNRWQRLFQLGRQTLPPEQRQHLALKKLAAQIAYPFEVRAAEDYTRGHGAQWQPVDLDSLSREYLSCYEKELLHAENLRSLISTPDGDWHEYFTREYQRARKALADGRASEFHYANPVSSAQGTMREKVLAHRVARLARKLAVVHVGGWEHLMTSGPEKRMADYLAAWKPTRLLLDDL